jgi:D-methionine transport system ATP-binding protein
LIQIRGLSKIFKAPQAEVRALEQVELNIKAGEIYGVIGLSGAGKSTLVRCINMLERPTSGSILIDGQEITQLDQISLRQLRQKIGMIFQHFSLLSSRNVVQNVMFPLQITHTPEKEAYRQALGLLEVVGLTDKVKAFPHQLSGGQKQRVAIARALANSPKLLLSDEATSALDPQTTQSIMELLRRINRELHLTIVLITHDMNVVKQACDRVSVMDNGQIVETAEVLELFSRPRSEAARRLVQAIVQKDIPADLLHLTAKEQARFVRISFIGNSAGEPLISSLVKQFDVMANILYASVDRIKDVPFGSLTLELLGGPESIAAAIEFLQTNGLEVEVLENV